MSLSRFFQSLRGKGKPKPESIETPVETVVEPVEDLCYTSDSPKTQIPLDMTDLDALAKTRRRLSVDGKDISLDGVDDIVFEMPNDIMPKEETHGDESSFFGIFAGKSQKGYVPYNPRKVNQDYMLIREDESTHTLVFGAFDGHGEHGHCISEFVCTSFYNNLISNSQYKDRLKEAALEALEKAESDCIKNRFIKTELSGTTAIICLIRDKKLITINVGDSRAILASEVGEDCVITELSHDHKPSLPEEKARIESAGGRVFAMEYDDGYKAPLRVWLADQDIPGLAMSRSICDTVAHSVGVLSTPEVQEKDLNADDRVIVIGSDGLWEFIPNDEVISIIEDCEQPEDAVERLATVSWKRWFDKEKVVDDTTIIVVFLGKPGEEM